MSTTLPPFLCAKKIELAAERLRTSSSSYVDSELGSSTPIEEIAEIDLRLNVDFDDLSKDITFHKSTEGFDDILGAMVFNNKQIMIDETLDPIIHPEKEGRYRFTLAHEIGHWMLHRHLFKNERSSIANFQAKPEKLILQQEERNDRLEWQANRFASCLLMPKIEIERLWFQRTRSFEPFSYKRHRDYYPLPKLIGANRSADNWIHIGEANQSPINSSLNANIANDRNWVFWHIAEGFANSMKVSVQSMQIRLEELQYLK